MNWGPISELISRLKIQRYATLKVNGGVWEYDEKRDELDGLSCASIDVDLAMWADEQIKAGHFTAKQFEDLDYAITNPKTQTGKDILKEFKRFM